jgi:AraC family transcriptional regulator, ethanolamine operon transcriptional activator
MAAIQEDRAHVEPDISTETQRLAEFDPQALAHVVNGAELEHRRLPGGKPEIRLLQTSLPQSILNRGTYSPAVMVKGTFASDAITLGAMIQQNEATILNGSKVKLGTLLFFPENTEMCYRAWPNAAWLTLVLSRQLFEEYLAEHLDCAPELARKGMVTFQPKQPGSQLLERLRDLNRSLPSLRALDGAARLGEMIENDLLARFANFISEKPLIRKENDRRQIHLCNEVLKDTIKMMERDPSEILNLRSMAKATGLSPRTLQRSFQAEFGLCPQEWQRVERLNRARKDLLQAQPGASVTKTATRWGFFHFGRFSQYYRELFNELPSETLARHSAMAA